MEPRCPDCRVLLRDRELTEPYDCSHERAGDGLMYHYMMWRVLDDAVALLTNGEQSTLMCYHGIHQRSNTLFECYDTALDALTESLAELLDLE